MYIVCDTYGTNQLCWTWRTALEWLAAAAPDAAIVSVLRCKVIATRTQRPA